MTQSEIQNTANIAAGNTSPASSVSASYRFVKRAFDIVVALVGLALLSPLFLIVSAAIVLCDGFPVLYRRRCVSKNGFYNMLKFRTMVKDADDLEKYLNAEQLEMYLHNCKLNNDPRIIARIGNFLRKTSMDELPQLVNVLKGEMSLVGPRPVTDREAAEYGSDRERLLNSRPGITGYWQVYGRENTSYLSDERRQMQLYYTEHRSIKLDVKLLFKTVAVIVSGKGAR